MLRMAFRWPVHSKSIFVSLLFVVADAVWSPFGNMWYPLDPEVGNVQQVSDAELLRRFANKSALFVGGTDGIGRGTAIAMAQAGASVVVVGHSSTKAEEVLQQMSEAAVQPLQQKFKAYTSDLFTVAGSFRLADELVGNKTCFDYVVLTVGMWPDWKDPRTADGFEKVIALDVMSRYLVTRQIIPLLNPEARVMSVLASGSKQLFWQNMDNIKTPTIQDVATTKSHRKHSLTEILGSASIMNDAWLQVMSKKHPHVSFIGTFPGIVATHLLGANTFPKWMVPLLNKGLQLMGMEPIVCGKAHAAIISSSNVARHSTTYFSIEQKHRKPIRLGGRLTAPLAYDAEFQKWTVSFLEAALANRSLASAADGFSFESTKLNHLLIV